MGESFPPGAILPKLGKFQDELLTDAADYYYALVRATARMAAADKRGDFDGFLGEYVWSDPPTNIPTGPDSAAARQAASESARRMVDGLTEFVVTLAPSLFPEHVRSADFLRGLAEEVAEIAPFAAAITKWQVMFGAALTVHTKLPSIGPRRLPPTPWPTCRSACALCGDTRVRHGRGPTLASSASGIPTCRSTTASSPAPPTAPWRWGCSTGAARSG